MVYNGYMKNSALNIAFLCIFVVVFIGTLFLIRAQFNVGEVSRPDTLPFVQDETTLVPVALAEYVNVRGEKWKLARGNYEFEVSAAADVYPQFVSGVLDPLDVKPGETQKMRVVINSTSALVEVVAEITHDKGKDIVPLRLVSAGAVSHAAQFKKDFFFDERGILTTREEWTATHKENSASLVASVEAQSIRQYVYEGEWVVHDTHRTTYNTVFRAKDDLGKSNFLTLAWSDPVCDMEQTNLSTRRQLKVDCSLTGAIDGVDGFDLFLNGLTINTGTGGIFAYAPGNSLTSIATSGAKTGGQLVRGTSGKITKQYVYYEDGDLDTYPSSSLNVFVNNATSWIGYIRMPNAPGADKRNPTPDCYDSNASAKPGQTAFFSTNRGDLSFDYNCNGKQQYLYTTSVDPIYTSPGVPEQCYSPVPPASGPGVSAWVYSQLSYEDLVGGQESIPTEQSGPIAHLNSVDHKALYCGLTATRYIYLPCSTVKLALVANKTGYGPDPISTTFTQVCR